MAPSALRRGLRSTRQFLHSRIARAVKTFRKSSPNVNDTSDAAGSTSTVDDISNESTVNASTSVCIQHERGSFPDNTSRATEDTSAPNYTSTASTVDAGTSVSIQDERDSFPDDTSDATGDTSTSNDTSTASTVYASMSIASQNEGNVYSETRDATEDTSASNDISTASTVDANTSVSGQSERNVSSDTSEHTREVPSDYSESALTHDRDLDASSQDPEELSTSDETDTDEDRASSPEQSSSSATSHDEHNINSDCLSRIVHSRNKSWAFSGKTTGISYTKVAEQPTLPQGPIWKMVGGFIERDGVAVGIADEMHENKMDELREENEETVGDLQKEIAELHRKVAHQQRLIKKRDEKLAQREPRARYLTDLNMKMDALKDQLIVQQHAHWSNWDSSSYVPIPAVAARDRIALRTQEVFFAAEQQRIARINELEFQVKTINSNATEIISNLQREQEVGPWRCEQLEIMNARQRTDLDAADKREAELGERINLAEQRIRQLRAYTIDLENQLSNLKAGDKTSSQLLTALEDFHTFCTGNLLKLAESNDVEAVRVMADYHDDFVASTFHAVDEYDRQKESMDQLTQALKDEREKNRVLTGKNDEFKKENSSLVRQNNNQDDRILAMEMDIPDFEEQIQKLKPLAPFADELKEMNDHLRKQLIHDWTNAAPEEWQSAIEELHDELSRVNDEKVKMTERAEVLQVDANELAKIRRNVDNEVKIMENMYARYAIEYNARKDIEKTCNDLRKRLGEPEIPPLMNGADPNNPLIPDLYKKKFDWNERWDLVLEFREGKYWMNEDFFGVRHGNESLFWGKMEKDEDGMYKEGESSFRLGDGSEDKPAGPSVRCKPIQEAKGCVLVDYSSTGGLVGRLHHSQSRIV